MSDQSEEIYSVNELSKIYQLLPKVLPTKTDCLLYVLSRTKHAGSRHHDIVYKLAGEIKTIWTDADCCPRAKRHIAKAFKREVWDIYLHLKREKCLPRKSSLGKRSHKKNASKQKRSNFQSGGAPELMKAPRGACSRH